MADEFETRLHQGGTPNQPQMQQTGNSNQTRMAGARPPFQPPKKKGFNKLLLLIPVAFILLIILGVGGFFGVGYFLSKDDTAEEQVERVQQDLSISEALNELAGLNLPLTRIQEIEANVIHTGTSADEEKLQRRLIALKHLYTNEFMRENHSAENVRNIYMLYSEDFSPEQQSMLKWFLNLSADKQRQWEYVQGGILDFSDFRQKVEAEMTRQ